MPHKHAKHRTPIQEERRERAEQHFVDDRSDRSYNEVMEEFLHMDVEPVSYSESLAEHTEWDNQDDESPSLHDEARSMHKTRSWHEACSKQYDRDINEAQDRRSEQYYDDWTKDIDDEGHDNLSRLVHETDNTDENYERGLYTPASHAPERYSHDAKTPREVTDDLITFDDLAHLSDNDVRDHDAEDEYEQGGADHHDTVQPSYITALIKQMHSLEKAIKRHPQSVRTALP